MPLAAAGRLSMRVSAATVSSSRLGNGLDRSMSPEGPSPKCSNVPGVSGTCTVSSKSPSGSPMNLTASGFPAGPPAGYAASGRLLVPMWTQ